MSEEKDAYVYCSNLSQWARQEGTAGMVGQELDTEGTCKKENR